MLQCGGPRTTPSGYPGGPVVPSGQLSPQHSSASSQIHQQPHIRSVNQHPSQAVGYSTTGRMSVHQQHTAGTPTTHQQHSQGPVSFTRALEISESIAEEGQITQTTSVPQIQTVTKAQATNNSGDTIAKDNQKRDSVYDANNYEISV